MPRPDPARTAERRSSPGSFVLYTEGARDRSILRGWSYRLMPARARRLLDESVILGGRQPARAIDHFRSLGGREAGARALCVLDRDAGPEEAEVAGPSEPGLDFFTWSRRHIESYLLVPAAICRSISVPASDGRVLRVLREHLPEGGDEESFRDLDAKRLLSSGGALARALGRPISPGRVAQATREAELHPDVHALFARLHAELERIGGAVTRRDSR